MLNRWNKVVAASAFAVATAGFAQVAPMHHDFGGRLHIGNVAVGGSGVFSTIVESSATPQPSGYAGYTSVPLDQYTTWSAGFVGSLQMHPFTWAGVQINYGFTHYQERFRLALQPPANLNQQQLVRVPTDMHEATAGYLIHPKHIPFQPYVTVGGGAIDFNPRGGTQANSATRGTYQWRGTGYLETGFDIPTHSRHVGFRVANRTLIYRSPDFATPAISYTSWRVTNEPTVSAVYKF